MSEKLLENKSVNLKILDLEAFAACVKAASKKSTNHKFMEWIEIRPDGTVIGTNHHYMIAVKKCVEPFKHEAFHVQCKNIPASQRKCGEGVLTVTIGKGIGEIKSSQFNVKGNLTKEHKHEVVAKRICYPDYKYTFKSHYTHNQNKLSSISFNVGYIYEIASVMQFKGFEGVTISDLDTKTSMTVTFEGKPNVKMLLAPMLSPDNQND